MEIVNIPDFWSTIRGLHSIQDAAADVFGLVSSIIEDSPSSITPDNYEAVILLLNDFATAGSAGAVIEQKRDRHVRRSRTIRPLDARYVAKLFYNFNLMCLRDNEVVKRGVKAVHMTFQLSDRVPTLIKQSQLERKEGT